MMTECLLLDVPDNSFLTFLNDQITDISSVCDDGDLSDGQVDGGTYVLVCPSSRAMVVL
jgi:hypothetical protein